MSANIREVTKGEQVQNILEILFERLPEAIMAIVASKEGLSIASVRRALNDRDEDTLAVAAAQILDMSAEVNKQLQLGNIGRILIEGDKRTTIVTQAGRDLILIVALPADAKLGLAMLSIRSTGRAIAKVYR